MARTVSLTDDYDGSQGAKERRFSIGRTDYVIDLTDENWHQLLTALEPWRSRARIRQHRQNRAPVTHPRDRAKIRAWAEEHGIELKARGRFPNDVVQRYYEEVGFQALDTEDVLFLRG